MLRNVAIGFAAVSVASVPRVYGARLLPLLLSARKRMVARRRATAYKKRIEEFRNKGSKWLKGLRLRDKLPLYNREIGTYADNH